MHSDVALQGVGSQHGVRGPYGELGKTNNKNPHDCEQNREGVNVSIAQYNLRLRLLYAPCRNETAT